jgi:1,4-dihydroxy-2-naphthoate octaprenyltransferase
MSSIKFQVVRSQITFGDLRLRNTHVLSLQVLGVLCKPLLHLVCVICIMFFWLGFLQYYMLVIYFESPKVTNMTTQVKSNASKSQYVKDCKNTPSFNSNANP